MRMPFLLLLLTVATYAQTLNELLIRIDSSAIYVDNEKIANADALKDVLENKKNISKKVLIQIDPEQSYNMLYKIVSICDSSGYGDVNIASKINGKTYTQPIFLPKKTEPQCLCLTVGIDNDYLGIWIGNSPLPKIFHKEMSVLAMMFEEDNIFETSIYSKNDSAYLSLNDNFLTKRLVIVGYGLIGGDVKVGDSVKTLAKNSARKLVCGKAASGEEDICTNGKRAIVEKPRSALDELTRLLIKIHDGFIEYHDSNAGYIAANGDVKVSNIFSVMHRIRTSGFTKINLYPPSELAKIDFYADSSRIKKDKDFAYRFNDVLREKADGEIISITDYGITRSRSEEDIMIAVEALTPHLREIYTDYLKQKPGFYGKVTLKFTVASSGDIIRIRIASSTTGYPEFDKAIRNAVVKWKFGAIGDYKTTHTIPFSFAE